VQSREGCRTGVDKKKGNERNEKSEEWRAGEDGAKEGWKAGNEGEKRRIECSGRSKGEDEVQWRAGQEGEKGMM